jgi:hypothetical protein
MMQASVSDHRKALFLATVMEGLDTSVQNKEFAIALS